MHFSQKGHEELSMTEATEHAYTHSPNQVMCFVKGQLLTPDFELVLTFSGVYILTQSVSSVAQLCPTLCDPMDCSTPGLLVHHQLLEFAQTYVH